jgi:hypothetical protein
MTFLYTALATFDWTYDNGGKSCDDVGKCSYQKHWNGYLEWSKLAHLSELVSLDGMTNETLVEPDYDDGDDWNFIHNDGKYLTHFYTTVDYVFKRMKAQDKFNLLTVVIEPDRDCKDIPIDGYEFVGYDLLDKEYGNSALTNCGGFDETFLPSDLNDKGLIDAFVKAYDIKKRLLENNPNEHHADTNVIAVWRHRAIGR